MMSKATPTHRATADAMFSRCVSLPSQPPSLSSGGASGPTLMSRRRDRIPVRYAVKMIRRLSAKAIQDSARRTVTFGSSGATLFTKAIETPSAPDESVRMALVEVSGGRVVGLPQPGVPIVFRNHPAPPKRTLAPTGDNFLEDYPDGLGPLLASYGRPSRWDAVGCLGSPRPPLEETEYGF